MNSCIYTLPKHEDRHAAQGQRQLDTDKGHKSNHGGTDRREAIAQEYAGQLAAYKDAVETASGEKVL